jgi:ATP-dependent 26S proteasome regulatory subunit
VYIPLPDMEGRRELFRINLKSLELGEGVDFDELATKAAGYSGADVANVCRCVPFAAYTCCKYALKLPTRFRGERARWGVL